jgi:hypothetical protein
MNLAVGISQLVASKFESRMAHTCVPKKTLTGKCLVWYLKGVFKKRFNLKMNETRRLFWIKTTLMFLSLAKRLPRLATSEYTKRPLRSDSIS